MREILRSQICAVLLSQCPTWRKIGLFLRISYCICFSSVKSYTWHLLQHKYAARFYTVRHFDLVTYEINLNIHSLGNSTFATYSPAISGWDRQWWRKSNYTWGCLFWDIWGVWTLYTYKKKRSMLNYMNAWPRKTKFFWGVSYTCALITVEEITYLFDCSLRMHSRLLASSVD